MFRPVTQLKSLLGLKWRELPGGTVVKNPPATVGDTRDESLIPWSGRHPGVENESPLQYSCLENSMDRGA